MNYAIMPDSAGMKTPTLGSAVAVAGTPSVSGNVIKVDPSAYEQALSDSYSTARDNSYLSQSFAERQMDFQAASQLASMGFNAAEAAKNRNWQEYMSNIAHQREVRDLMAAGLNPILSAMGGNGATTGSGATASSQAMSGASGSVDTSANQAVANLISAEIGAKASRDNTRTNAITNLAVAEQDRKNKIRLQQMQNETALDIAHISENVSRYNTDAGVAIAQIGAAASMYGAAQNAGAILGAAGINAASSRDVANIYAQQSDKDRQYKYWHDIYASGSPWQTLSNLTGLSLNVLGDIYGKLTPDQRKNVQDAMIRGIS